MTITKGGLFLGLGLGFVMFFIVKAASTVGTIPVGCTAPFEWTIVPQIAVLFLVPLILGYLAGRS